MTKHHVEDFFNDLAEPHPENFRPDENYHLRTHAHISVEDMYMLEIHEQKLKRKEIIGNLLTNPLSSFIVYLVIISVLLMAL